ncbi:uncharacterized protein SPSC_00023 [Sporisorium scitamineum]|uniref:Uncharacterized protein n=1 Tax=Sporisorium scitamineum TaxID=49012 RepID=A0A127Z557_9BASI|nr:uncharacterized protein SPSC_00023 [Sporisorium scitamineum]
MSSNNSNNHTAHGRSTFATSSSDFALPFGGSRSTNAGTNSGSSSSSSSSNVGFFQSASSSIPISIPSSPSLALSFNGQAGSHHTPMLSLSTGINSSPSKLVISGAGLGIGNLPSPSARDHTNPLASTTYNAPPQSPTLSLAGEGWPPPPFHGFSTAASSSSSTGGVATPAALLRRGPGMNSPGFAIASPPAFDNDRSDEEERSHDTAQQQQQQQQVGGRRRSNQDPDDGDDEMMQVEEEDALASRGTSTPLMGPPLSLFNVPSTPPPATAAHLPNVKSSLASSALARASASDSGQDSSSSAGGMRTVPRSPSSGPSMGSPLGPTGNRSRSSSLLSSNVVRKAVTRRGNLLPKDRSVARVAASLQDESKPEDSEIASEAKLQKRLGGEATLPRTPRFGASAAALTSSATAATSSSSGGTMRVSRSPFFGAAGANGAAGAAGVLGAGFSRRKYMWDDDVDDIRGVFTADGLDDGESSVSSEEEEMMMYYSRTGSISDEEDEMRSRMDASDHMQDSTITATPGANDASAQSNGIAGGCGGAGSNALSTSFGSAAGVVSTSGVGSLSKRSKNALWMGFRDKGNTHKWSPGGSNVSSERWRRPPAAAAAAAAAAAGMDVDTSPRVLASAASAARLSKRKTMGDDRYEPYKRRAVSPVPSSSGFAAAVVAQSGGGNSPLLMPVSSPSGVMYRGVHYANYARYSTSPTISRPCTPVQSAAASAATSAVVAMGGFSPAASGSGPGYGSGALGLSISANNPQSLESRMQLEQQQQNEALMDEKVGMLGLS